MNEIVFYMHVTSFGASREETGELVILAITSREETGELVILAITFSE